MNKRETIIATLEQRSLDMLNHALREQRYRTARNVAEDREALVEAHRLLECATMLRALPKGTPDDQ